MAIAIRAVLEQSGTAFLCPWYLGIYASLISEPLPLGTPRLPAGPEFSTFDLVTNEQSPPSRKEVQFDSPPAWVTIRELDQEYRAPAGSPESVLLIDHQHHAEEHACYTRVARRLHTMAAVQHAAQWKCDFDPATQRVVIHSLAVCRDGTRFEQGEESSARILQREENLERFILDGTMTVVVLLRDVRLDDVIDVSYTIYSKLRILAEHYFSFAAIPTGAHVRLFSISVRFAAGKPMAWKTDSTKLQRQERSLPNGETEWSWQVERFAPREPEAQMPPWFFQGRFIQFSNIPDWGCVSRGLHAAWKEDFEHETLKDAVSRIAVESTVDQRVEAALRMVQDDIRYLSVNTELGGQIPANPGDVLGRRFGDCKDKAFLLAHLLRQLGVRARPVLVNANVHGKVREFLPMPAAFNHAIVEFELSGTRHWVDATIHMQGGGPAARFLPPFEVGLPLGLDVQELEEVSIEQGVEAHYRLRESFRLETPDTLLLTVVTDLTGSHADDQRYREANEGAAACARQREERYRAIHPSAERRGEAIIRDDRSKNAFAMVDSYLIPGVVVATREPGVGAFQFPLHLIHAALRFPDTEKRKYPLALPFPCSIEQKVECEFRVLSARGTEVIDLHGKQFYLNLKVNSRPTSFAWAFRYSTSANHVPAEDYSLHRKKVHEALGSTVLTVLVPIGSRSSGSRRSMDEMLPAWTRDAAAPSRSEPVAVSQPALAAALTSLPVRPERKRPARPPVQQATPPRTSRATLQTSPTAEHRARNISAGLFFLYVIIHMLVKFLGAMK